MAVKYSTKAIEKELEQERSEQKVTFKAELIDICFQRLKEDIQERRYNSLIDSYVSLFHQYSDKADHILAIDGSFPAAKRQYLAIFKKANNKRKRQTNAGNPAVKQNQVPYEPRQGASPDFGPSIHEGGPSSWTTSSQWDSDRDCRAEGIVPSFPFPPGPPGQPLHGESAYCPSQQCHRA